MDEPQEVKEAISRLMQALHAQMMAKDALNSAQTAVRAAAGAVTNAGIRVDDAQRGLASVIRTRITGVN